MDKAFLNPDDAVCTQHALMLLDYLDAPGEVLLDADRYRFLQAKYGLTRQEVKRAINLLAKHGLVTVTTEQNCILVSLLEMGRRQRSEYADRAALLAAKSVDSSCSRRPGDKEGA